MTITPLEFEHPFVRRAELTLVFDTRGGQTFLASQLVRAPLKVLRPFPLEDGRVLLQILNVGPGVMAGDYFDVRVHLNSHARVVIVNQSATKLHQMPAGTSARQDIAFTLDAHAELEYYPGLSIPYVDADFQQTIRVELADTAKFAMLESWAMGRVAQEERFCFRQLRASIRIARAKHPVYADALHLNPQQAQGPALTDGHDYVSTGVWLWGTHPAALQSQQQTISSTQSSTLISGHFAPNAFYVRGLSNDSLTLTRQTRAFINTWRQHERMPALNLSRYTS